MRPRATVPSSVKAILPAALLLLAAACLSLLALNGPAAESADVRTSETQAGPKSPPPFAVRELYAVGHFGNSYEVMGEYEMRRYLAEAKHGASIAMPIGSTWRIAPIPSPKNAWFS